MAGKSLFRLMKFGRIASDAKQSVEALPQGSATMRFGSRAGIRYAKKRAHSQRGSSLIESMMASMILIIVVVGLLPVLTMGFKMTEQQGDIATRTTEYADDKMESLLNLIFTDGTTNTATFPASAGGTGLGGVMLPSTTVGAVAPAAAVAGYVDYFDFFGNLQTVATGATYVRQWKITTDATGNLKTITVSVTSLQKAGVLGIPPSTTVVCVKSSAV